MTVSRSNKRVAAAVALCMTSVVSAFAASPKPVDLGLSTEQAISVTITLRLRDLAGAEAMMRSVATPGDRLFQQFLTPAVAHVTRRNATATRRHCPRTA